MSVAALALMPASVAGAAVDPLLPEDGVAAPAAATPSVAAVASAAVASAAVASAAVASAAVASAAVASAAVPGRIPCGRFCAADMRPSSRPVPTRGRRTLLAPSCGLRVIPVLAKREGSVRDGAIPAIRGAGGARLEPVSAENGTVVVVEDDPNIADLVDLYLRREGYRVLLAADGDRGLEVFSRE